MVYFSDGLSVATGEFLTVAAAPFAVCCTPLSVPQLQRICSSFGIWRKAAVCRELLQCLSLTK